MRRQKNLLGKNLSPVKVRASDWVSHNSVILLVLVVFLVQGCKNNPTSPLTNRQIHSITEQLASAASSAAPQGTRVLVGHGGTNVQALQGPDSISILIDRAPSTEAVRANIARILRSMNTVAVRNHLTQDNPVQKENTLHLTLRRSGVVTHKIKIVTGVSASAGPVENVSSGPRLAIILDDLGADRAAADAVFALPYPLTISVLPDHAHSAEIAEEAHRRGYEVMLHLPMQSVGNEKPEAHELHPGMTQGEVTSVVDQFLKEVPDVAGVNNHQGSQATADSALMQELMPILKKRQLFYVDSRTTTATVAYDTAQRLGVRAGFRNVPFLDDIAEASAVRKQLELAIRGAQEKGEAIAIGHPHPATLQALGEMLPQAEAQGVRLVFASDLVH